MAGRSLNEIALRSNEFFFYFFILKGRGGGVKQLESAGGSDDPRLPSQTDSSVAAVSPFCKGRNSSLELNGAIFESYVDRWFNLIAKCVRLPVSTLLSGGL